MRRSGTWLDPKLAETFLLLSSSPVFWTALDSEGDPFDGGRTYRLTLPKDIPVKDFWSVIVYDTQTRSMLQTDQPAPSVSSQDKDVLINADGSVDVFFGPEAPAGFENNWIQTIPGKGWFMILRLYGRWSLGSTDRGSPATSRR